MTAYQVAGLVAVIIVAGGSVFLHDRLNRRRALKLLASRPQLPPDEFGRSYFGETPHRAALAAELREMLEDHVPFKLDGLAPDDALVQDLRMDALDSMSTVEFLLEVEERYRTKVPESVAESLRTLRDLVDYLEPRIRVAE
jgi:acyl carrier protein